MWFVLWRVGVMVDGVVRTTSLDVLSFRIQERKMPERRRNLNSLCLFMVQRGWLFHGHAGGLYICDILCLAPCLENY